MIAVGNSRAESYPLSVAASILYLTVPLHSIISSFNIECSHSCATVQLWEMELLKGYCEL